MYVYVFDCENINNAIQGDLNRVQKQQRITKELIII